MTKTSAGQALSDAAWADLVTRQPSEHFYAVATTGIVCRHGCPARTPLRKNVRLFDTFSDAIAAGFRPCKRCQPNTDHPVSRAKASAASVPSFELP